ncbi:MAG: hypothetical protein EBY34_01225, partial [Alphaproteobacteria bacterium]|nr:hypothetical protein [Alphaproteobacteria bacterium]
WRVTGIPEGKIKKTGDGQPPILSLAENPDILRHLATHASRPRLVVGFAAEAADLQETAMAKLARKGCDWIVANMISDADGKPVCPLFRTITAKISSANKASHILANGYIDAIV